MQSHFLAHTERRALLGLGQGRQPTPSYAQRSARSFQSRDAAAFPWRCLGKSHRSGANSVPPLPLDSNRLNHRRGPLPDHIETPRCDLLRRKQTVCKEIRIRLFPREYERRPVFLRW